MPRITFYTIVGLLLAACAVGYVIAVGAVRPENLLAAETAIRNYSLHGGLGSLELLVAPLWFASARVAPAHSDRFRGFATLAALAALALLARVLLVLFAAHDLADMVRLVFGALEVSVSVACVLAALGPGGFGLALLTPLRLALAIVALAALASGVTAIGSASLSFREPARELLVLVAIAALGEPGSEGPRRPWALLAVLVLAASVLRLIDPTLGGWALEIGCLPAGAILAHAAWRRAATRPSLARWAARTAALLFVQAVLLRRFLGITSVDSHLHDTLFVVGVSHLEYTVAVFALLAGWLEDRAPTPRQRRFAAVALGLAALGVHAMCWAYLLTGSRGMPRSYAQYVPQFQALHVAIALGATLFVLGLLVTVLGVGRARVTTPDADVFG